jgi:hypothetical protein
MRQHQNSREVIIPAVAYIWLAFYALAMVYSFVSAQPSTMITAKNEEIASAGDTPRYP